MHNYIHTPQLFGSVRFTRNATCHSLILPKQTTASDRNCFVASTKEWTVYSKNIHIATSIYIR